VANTITDSADGLIADMVGAWAVNIILLMKGIMLERG
jgi:hypothetical protein